MVLLVVAVGLLWIGYIKAASGGSAGDGRLAVSGAFLAAFAAVVLGLRAAPRMRIGQGAARPLSPYALAGLALAAVVLAFAARAASPLWHGSFIAGLAGVMAALAAISLARPGLR